jgi:hypothetical protein
MDPEVIVAQIDWAISKIEKAFDTPAHRWLKWVRKKLEVLQPEPKDRPQFVTKVAASEPSVSFGPKPFRNAGPNDTQERKTA